MKFRSNILEICEIIPNVYIEFRPMEHRHSLQTSNVTEDVSLVEPMSFGVLSKVNETNYSAFQVTMIT